MVGSISRRGDVPAYAGPAVLRRLATVLKGVELDCQCRSRLDVALARFEALERRRTARQHLQEARRQREGIVALLSFLKDLDELAPDEADRSVCNEMALIFEDIAAMAKEGSDAVRRLSYSAR